MASGFPIDWPELKQARYEHDDKSCVRCGAEEHLYISLQSLPNEFENSEDAWKNDNLITLCEDHIVEGGKHELTRIDETFDVGGDNGSSQSLNVGGVDSDDSLGGVATFDFDEDDEDSVDDSSKSLSSGTVSDEPTTTPTDSDVSTSSDSHGRGENVSFDQSRNTGEYNATFSRSDSSRFGSFMPSKSRVGVSGYISTIVEWMGETLSPTIETGGVKWDGVYRFGEENYYLKTVGVMGAVSLLIGLLWVSYALYSGASIESFSTDISLNNIVIVLLGGFVVTYFISMVSRVLTNSDSTRYQSRWVQSHLGSLYKMSIGIVIGFVSLQLVIGDASIVHAFVGNVMYMVSMFAIVASLSELLAEEASKNGVVTGSWFMEYLARVFIVCGVVEVLIGSVGAVYGETAGIVVTILPVILGVIFLLRIFSIRMNA